MDGVFSRRRTQHTPTSRKHGIWRFRRGRALVCTISGIARERGEDERRVWQSAHPNEDPTGVPPITHTLFVVTCCIRSNGTPTLMRSTKKKPWVVRGMGTAGIVRVRLHSERWTAAAATEVPPITRDPKTTRLQVTLHDGVLIRHNQLHAVHLATQPHTRHATAA